jgi:putative ABC transport system substrate-binding protein
MMRRGGLALLLAAFAAAPLATPAQPAGKVPRVGFLANIRSPATAGFEEGMRELGYVDGRTVIIEWRLAQGRFDRLPELVQQLVALKVDVIVAPAPVYVEAATQATQTIPIVFALVDDPVARGFVKSLARPGGNVTGLSTIATELAAKRVEILREAVPHATRLGVLTSPGADARVHEMDRAAKAVGFRIEIASVSGPGELESALATLARKGVSAAIEAPGDPMFYQERRRIADLALKHRLPLLADARESVEAGALMSYGASFPDLMRRSASYVDRIIKGAKPADLPVQQATKFELLINLKTAKALGLTIPPVVLERADELIR